MNRYSLIENKNKREIVLLRGTGCRWHRCTFCDYHLDSSSDENSNRLLNSAVLQQVTGLYGQLEIINSGSFCDLDGATMADIRRTCITRGISTVYFECHYLHRRYVPALRHYFSSRGINVKIKTGIETFDADFRERVLNKGISENDPAKLAADFDQACLLFGISGQTEHSMRHDIETGLKYFERICINIMTRNSTAVHPDPDVISIFRKRIFPQYQDDPRIDILMNNTDFGVGAPDDA